MQNTDTMPEAVAEPETATETTTESQATTKKNPLRTTRVELFPVDPPQHSRTRLTSLDALRGLAMLLMVSAGLAIPQVVNDNADLAQSPVWSSLAAQLEHAPWVGCRLWDLIQPAFMFVVGASMPFSLGKRRSLGQSWLHVWAHAAIRALTLVVLGVMIASNWSSSTNFVFTNVLAQIGLGYLFVLLLSGRGMMLQTVTLVWLAVVSWVLFYLYPAPPADFDYSQVGFEGFEPLTGLFAHWNPNNNVGWWLDDWLLNQFARPEPWEFSSGGYHTLNFLPSIITMLLGLMAGELLASDEAEPGEKLAKLLVAAVFAIGIGHLAGLSICPMVKRIWTPSWAIYSGGWVMLLLAVFYGVLDIGRQKWLAWPVVVVGMNPLTIYLMAQFTKPWLRKQLRIHLDFLRQPLENATGFVAGEHIFDWKYGPMLEATFVLSLLWLVAVWMYQRRLFIRV